MNYFALTARAITSYTHNEGPFLDLNQTLIKVRLANGITVELDAQKFTLC